MSIKSADTLEPNGSFPLAQAKHIVIGDDEQNLEEYIANISAGGSSIDDSKESTSKTYSSSKIADLIKTESARIDTVENANKERVKDITEINEHLSTIEGVVSSSASELGSLQYKSKKISRTDFLYGGGLDKKIGETGAYVNVEGYTVWSFDVTLYKGKKIRVSTGFDSPKAYIKFAFYRKRSTVMAETLKEDNAVFVSEPTEGLCKEMTVDVPSDATAFVVCSKSTDDAVSCLGLIDRISSNEQLLANSYQICSGTAESWYNAFKSIAEISKDRIAYINDSYGDKYQVYKYIGVGDANKSDISYWRPENENDDTTYALESRDYTDREGSVAGAVYKYRAFKYTFPKELQNSVTVTLNGAKWSGLIKAYDKNGVMIYSGYSTALPRFVKTITVENRVDVYSEEKNFIIVDEQSAPQNIRDNNYTLTINSKGQVSYPAANPSYSKYAMFLDVEGGESYIYAKSTINMGVAFPYCNIYDESLELIKTVNITDGAIGSCDVKYNKAFIINVPHDARYISVPKMLFNHEAEEKSDNANPDNIIFCKVSEYYRHLYSTNPRTKDTDVRLAILGDSTSSTGYGSVIFAKEHTGASGAWVSFFNSIVQPKAVYNYANGGATVSDPSVTLTGGVAQTDANTYVKQLESMLSNIESGVIATPDYIFIVGCTNDEGQSTSESSARYVTEQEVSDSKFDDYESYMESTFVTNDNVVLGIENVNIGKIAGAMRYIIERSMRALPEVKFIVVTPLRNNSTSQAIQSKCVRDMEWMAGRLSIPVINVFRECNMPMLFDDASGNRHWLADPYHPYSSKGLKQGAAWHGKFIAKRFLDILDYKCNFTLGFVKASIALVNETSYSVSVPSSSCIGDTVVGYVDTEGDISVTVQDDTGANIDVTLKDNGTSKAFSFRVDKESILINVSKVE